MLRFTHMTREEYLRKLRDPRWQRVRLEVMQRDLFMCTECGDAESTLNVHHKYYRWGADPWDYPLRALATLCESCHEYATAEAPEKRAAERRLIEECAELDFHASDVAALIRVLRHFNIDPIDIACGLSELPDLPPKCAPRDFAMGFTFAIRELRFVRRACSLYRTYTKRSRAAAWKRAQFTGDDAEAPF